METNHVYKSIELTGSSTTTVDDAVRNAVAKASKSLHNLRWFEVKEIRGGRKIGEDVILHQQTLGVAAHSGQDGEGQIVQDAVGHNTEDSNRFSRCRILTRALRIGCQPAHDPGQEP